MVDYKKTAKDILSHTGGSENILNMTHCATRLRLNLKDSSKADDEAIKNVEGVVDVINKAGQYQILIGTEVPHVYDEFELLVKGNESNSLGEGEKKAEISSVKFSQLFQEFLCLSCQP